ncbi:hypothetical protein Tco_0383345 [Tanacetum coccineum]
MDPSSSVGKTCLGENVIKISNDKAEGHRDWNSPAFQDTANSGGKKETKAMVFHKMDTEEISDRFVAPCFVNGLEAYDGEINLGVEENMISNEFAVKLCLDHEVKRGNKVVKKELIIALRGEIYFVKFIINPVEDDVETGVVFGRSFMRLPNSEEEEKFGDDWDLLLDDLDFGDIPNIEGVYVPQFVYGMNKEEEKAIIKIKGEAVIEKDDPEAFMIPIRLEAGQRGSTECKKANHYVELLEGKAYGASEHCYVPGRGILYTYGGILNTIDIITSTFDRICHQTFCAAKTSLDIAESDIDDEEEYFFQRKKFGAPIYGPKHYSGPLYQSLALLEVLNPFRKICVWKKVISSLRSLLVALQHVEWKPNYTRCFNKKEDSDGQWHTMRGNCYEAGSSRTKRSKQYKTVEEALLPQVHHEMGCGEEIDGMLRINLCEAGINEEIFTFVAWIRAFNINKPIYLELCHEFYSTYEFDEVCADDELKTKKIIKFRLGGRAHSLTLHQNGYANVAWLIARWMKRKGASTQREILICCGQFITKLARNARVLSDEVLRSLSAPIYYRYLDTTTLIDLIDSESRLIPEAL